MSQWTPCKRRDFIRRLRKIGFEGPYSGTRHQFMILGRTGWRFLRILSFPFPNSE